MRSIYFLLLAAVIGTELTLGILVAPVIFSPQNIIGEGVLTHFMSGQMMTKIFLKFNYVLLFVSAFVAVSELFDLRKKLAFSLKFSTFMLSFLNLALALSFVFIFTPFIVQAQSLGADATQTAEFAKMHSASEYVMKVMLVLQLILFFLKFKISQDERQA
ncbi:hypothetical protein B9N60_07265 [Campylobacter concisus]|uniref:TMEM205-like domain-containing protein n=1 Tax=Campylobacter concisus TaxID=199 RepID=A0A1Y5NG36_9BACT|nr:DUF4149 domain-containing protein [Campylobacter concisus]OUT16965.1 hypothetical protein B9N60_07265 [Campylobacter concisus]